MNPNARLVEESVEFKTQAAADRSFDTSFEEEKVVVNPTPSSVISKDVEAIQALEITDIMQTSVEDNSNESNISRTRVFPDVPFDSKSSKEIDSKEMDQSIFSVDESNTRDVPDVLLDSESSKESQIKKVWPTEDNLEKDNYPTHGNRYQHYENRFQGCFGKGIQEE